MRFIAALLAPARTVPTRSAAGLAGRIAAAAVFGVFSVSAALADDDDIKLCIGGGRDCPCAHEPELPQSCKHDRITAAGEQTLGVIRSKHYLARKAWQRQVIDKFGERFQQWEKAACPKTECGPGSIAGYTRCEYSAYPCSPDADKVAADLLRNPIGGGDYREADRGPDRAPDIDRDRGRDGGYDRSVDDRELGPQEIEELQHLLRRAGYEVSIDGQFGEQTSAALIRWQRRAGVREDGEATFRNLRELKRLVQ
jgi:hypothetical protein